MQGLEIFVRVVEAGSFTAAARRAGTTASAVSKSMARLEKRLGARLFQRSTRAFALTLDGEAYYERVGPLVRAIEEAQEVFDRSGSASGRLRISMPSDFGRFLVEALTTRFRLAQPQVSLEVSMTDRHVDLIREGYDVALRVGRVADSGLISRPLGNLPMVLVASPAYIRANGAPDSAGALARHAHIRYMLNGRAYPILFEDGEQFVAQSGFDTDSGEAMRIAARNGLGIAHILRASVADELAAGHLVPVLAGRPLPQVPVQALHAFARAVPLRTQALFRFLDAEMAAWRSR